MIEATMTWVMIAIASGHAAEKTRIKMQLA
jgi:hypothetical protein